MFSTILFEDHTCTNFRPLNWGLPTYELRCGMFNLRERVALLLGETGKGGLLPRPFLEEFHHPKDWAVGPEAVASYLSGNEKVLFLNGRVGPDFTFIKDLMDSSQSAENMAIWDDQGLLAAWVEANEAQAVVQSLAAWHETAANSGVWFNSKAKPEPWDGGPIASYSKASTPSSLRWIWELVPATTRALLDDLKIISTTTVPARDHFGIIPDPKSGDPVWRHPSNFSLLENDRPSVSILGDQGVWAAEGCRLDPGTVIDTSEGPVILDREVHVMANAFLEGPLYLGPGCIVKAGATIYGQSSFGTMCRISGEIGESTFGDFSNKQHDGFVGHAVLGSWVNLGALTTNSDLKNNYGPVRVDLGLGLQDTGQRFVGLLMGDHAKTAIGSMFNTGTCVGFATNIFGGAMPPKFVDNFCWGGQEGSPAYDPTRAADTAGVVMGRRGCMMQDFHRKLFMDIANG